MLFRSTSVTQFYYFYNVAVWIKCRKESSSLYEDYFVNAKNVDLEFPEQKRNVIQIFLESMETTYSTPNYNGAMKENLIPELSKLAINNYTFNQKGSSLMNGAHVLGNTSWTVGGLVGQTSGVPLNIPINGNQYISDSFLPGIYNLGDILKEQGYTLDFLCGSESTYGGRANYFKQHGDYNIFDYNTAKAKKIIDPDYYVFWGYEDEILYVIAKSEILERASSH